MKLRDELIDSTLRGKEHGIMVIKCLVENTSISQEYKSKHGLSIYIETSKHKILFDVGPNGLFLENAKKLGIDITDIDTVVISHGHADHGKGLKLFLENNHTAKIYLTKAACTQKPCVCLRSICL